MQTSLARRTEKGVARLVAWLPADPRVRRGSVVSLDKEIERWTVEAQHTAQDAGAIDTRWGLGLPRGQRTER